LVKSKSTGTPKQLAKKLNCSERTARQKIEILREAGLPIAYSKNRCTYYYTDEVNLAVYLSLGNDEVNKIRDSQSN
jgi:predicted DNA-binding transcriptional regulator YafY